MQKILLVADVRGWIFERHCLEISKRLSNKYQFKIVYSSESPNTIPQIAQGYDLVYVLDPMPIKYPPKEKTIIGLRCEWLYDVKRGGPQKLYDEMYKNKCAIMHVVNHRQLNVFNNISEMPLLLVQHGVDTDLFVPPRQKNKHEFSVACSGRPSLNKGFIDVRDCCFELGVKFNYAMYDKNYRSMSFMPEFYEKSDVYVCYSESEGLNNSILEAGAMGLSIISTRCGEAENILSENRGILIERNINELKKAINILKDSETRIKMSEKIRREIVDKWSWDVKIHEYDNMFKSFFEVK